MNRKKMILMGLSVALCLLQPVGRLGMLAWAERWEFLGKHPMGVMYLDKDSVLRRADGKSTFWVKRVYSKPQESKISQMKFTEQRVMQILDCRKRTMEMNPMIFFDAKGKPVGAYIDLKGGPKTIQPDGFFAKEAKMLCAVGQETKTANATPKPVPKPAIDKGKKKP